MKYLFFVLIIISSGCNNSNENKEILEQEKCEVENLQELKRDLRKINEVILKENPILLKNYEAQPIEINAEVSCQIDSIFLNFCKEIEEEIEFKRFALIYLYNFKLNQYKCCIPGETEVIGENFINMNHRKNKDGFGIAMTYLLRENGTSKDDIIYNGFTQSQIHFEKTIKLFENDASVMKLVKDADDEMTKAYLRK